MDQDLLESIRESLSLVNEVEDEDKIKGLALLHKILHDNYPKLVAFGYDQVILKDLLKLAQFESSQVLEEALNQLDTYYFGNKNNLDEVTEIIIYRVAQSADHRVNLLCLGKLSKLIDHFDESVAKHSKQILKLADLNQNTSLNPLLMDILNKLKPKLPKRNLGAL